jgi:hypothetical protein
MNKFLVLMACAMFIFAFVHMAHADDEMDDSEDGMSSFRFLWLMYCF